MGIRDLLRQRVVDVEGARAELVRRARRKRGEHELTMRNVTTGEDVKILFAFDPTLPSGAGDRRLTAKPTPQAAAERKPTRAQKRLAQARRKVRPSSPSVTPNREPKGDVARMGSAGQAAPTDPRAWQSAKSRGETAFPDWDNIEF